MHGSGGTLRTNQSTETCHLKLLHLKYVVLFCAAAVVARAGGTWSGVQAGMNPVQVQRLVGVPLFATAGHGYLRWSFDSLGDVTFYRGAVVSWTEPRLAAEAPVAAVAIEVRHIPEPRADTVKAESQGR